MDVPQIGPANIASSTMTEPTAIPGVISFSAAPVETLRITNIKIAVRINSSMNDSVAEPVGSVAANVALCGKRKGSMALAANAPAHWLRTYGVSSRNGKRRGCKTTQADRRIQVRAGYITNRVYHCEHDQTERK